MRHLCHAMLRMLANSAPAARLQSSRTKRYRPRGHDRDADTRHLCYSCSLTYSVPLITGREGTTVTLTVGKPSGDIVTVNLCRSPAAGARGEDSGSPRTAVVGGADDACQTLVCVCLSVSLCLCLCLSVCLCRAFFLCTHIYTHIHTYKHI